jgi:hypothetical protein
LTSSFFWFRRYHSTAGPRLLLQPTCCFFCRQRPRDCLQPTCFFCRQRPRDCLTAHVLLLPTAAPRLFNSPRAASADSGRATVLQATCCFFFCRSGLTTVLQATCYFCRQRPRDCSSPHVLLLPTQAPRPTPPPPPRQNFFFPRCLSPPAYRFEAAVLVERGGERLQRLKVARPRAREIATFEGCKPVFNYNFFFTYLLGT